MDLWESVSIGDLELENRLVMLATHLSYCDEDGIVTDKLVEFYRERAKHKPGLIIIGGCYTEHLGMSTPTMIGISRDDHIEGLQRLTEAVHSHDVPISAQLYHAGRYAHSIVLGQQAVSASEVKCRLTRETPRALTLEEITQTVDNFGIAAERAKKAGFDSVEILGSTGYLINQFLAEATNKRRDGYGGDFESRLRFPLEIVECVRKAVGSKFPILYRMSGADFVPDGLTLEDNKILAPRLVEKGVDCLNVTGGWHETRIPQITMDVPRGGYAYLAEGIASVVDVPVVACNRINSVSVAERILSRGNVQLIGMSRGFLADPELPSKARANKHQLTRPCIACNQGCLDKVFMIEPVTCALNPLAGYETERELGPQGEGRIAVVGGGPAGMETARVLAMRGFDITLYEKGDRLGGMLHLAAKVPGRGEFAAYVSYMERELKNLGVDIRLKVQATVDTLVDEGSDCVVVATGTVAGAPSIEGVEMSHVTTAYDAISLGLDNLGDVVIVGGSALGCYTALYLASRADSVHIFESDEALGVDLSRTTRWVIMKSLKEKGIHTHANAQVTEITSGFTSVLIDGEYEQVDAQTVVLATRPQPQDRILKQLERTSLRTEVVGSMKKAMDLLEVIHETYKFANSFQL
ncbi:MAG: FAD-dependent oxidoreductase [Candidatus Thorarchaeota archaeon]|nr:FAD-dependent oxidoreductase [Candidatus Thorarchaeota archaeon]